MEQNFKLLAIRPLKGCHLKYRKLLKEDAIYQFYNEYEFIKRNGILSERVVEIRKNENIADNLYSLKTITGKKIAIDISAIVGMNGSGKSTLMELFFLCTYVISTKTNLLEANIESLKKELEKLDNNDSKIEAKDFLNRQIRQIENVYDKLKVEFFYSIGNSFFCVRVDNGNYLQTLVQGDEIASRNYTLKSLFDEDTFDFKDFFYTVAVNYSVYGLNSLHTGNWINSLFHKNDAYQTPIVINPMRTAGNYDINSETHLAQSRVLANFTSMSSKEIVEGKTVKNIIFKIDEKKLENFGVNSFDNVLKKMLSTYQMTEYDIFKKVYETILNDRLEDLEVLKTKIVHFDLIVKYTIKKIFKIAKTYKEFQDFYELPTNNPPIPVIKNLDNYLIALGGNTSHITLKLRQILNIVRCDFFREDFSKKVQWKGGAITLTVEEFILRLNEAKISFPNNDSLEFIPVAFFNPTIQVDHSSNFSVLSSGEQQFINCVQSILYHLINLNSVDNTNKKKIKNKFNYVNIFLDEIELYFHPEFQRKLISELLSGIKRLNITKIDGINILFSTHSPFILSDIPSSNILKIKKGFSQPYQKSEKTFGANIYELLKNDFFLSGGTIGEFSKFKIQEVIDSLNLLKTKSNHEHPILAKEEMIKIISMIGDSIVKHKLMEMYWAAFGNDELVDREIEMLSQRISYLKKKKND